MYNYPMQQLVKIVFFFIAAVYIVSYLNTVNLSGGFNLSDGSRTNDGLSDRNEYNRSYDTNADGFISDEEYRQGEISRIADEVEELEDAVAEALENENRSPFSDMVTLSANGVRAERRNDEYVTLRANNRNTSSINITGWYVKSLVSERGGTIKKGVQLLDDNRPWHNEQDIYLAPGDTAIVTTGSAAGIATSFLTNACVGYFDRDRFTPSVRSSCPLLEDEDLDSFGLAYDDFRREDDYDACMNAIESVRSCQIVRSPDRDLEDDCRDFIKEYSNYDGCVELHKDDPDFYGDEWRIFLGSSKNDLWRNEREAIGLYDSQGRLVDMVKY